jgi:hypothetical protein
MIVGERLNEEDLLLASEVIQAANMPESLMAHLCRSATGKAEDAVVKRVSRWLSSKSSYRQVWGLQCVLRSRSVSLLERVIPLLGSSDPGVPGAAAFVLKRLLPCNVLQDVGGIDPHQLLVETDRPSDPVVQDIGAVLPAVSKWFSQNKARMVYDEMRGTFVLR